MLPVSNNVRRYYNTNTRVREERSRGQWFEENRVIAREWVDTWRSALNVNQLGGEVLAGMTVAAVALPLNVALALACGLPPTAGLMAGIFGGAVAAIFGGSILQVTGPAAALNFMVLAMVQKYGPTAAFAGAIITGLICLLFSLMRVGKLARFVPEAILAGFTTGVGLKLLDVQLPELLGVNQPASDLLASIHNPIWLHKVSWFSTLCGIGVAMMTVSMAKWKRVPAALLGILLVTALTSYLGWDLERIGDIPSELPDPALPALDSATWLAVTLQCIPMAVLSAVESLLSARIVDRMSGVKKAHQPNLELFGQGLANVASGFFGGMPVTGVVVRSSVNIQSGGKSRLSALIHAVFLLLAVLFLGKWMALVPVPALAGLLSVVGFRLLEGGTFLHLLKEMDIGVLSFVLTAGGTVAGRLEEGLLAATAVHFIHWALTRKERLQQAERDQKEKLRHQGIRAVVSSLAREAEHRKPAHFDGKSESLTWLRNLNSRARIPASSFVHPDATVIGYVVLGENVHVAADCSIRADEGTPFFIGSNSNVQDGVVMHALKEKWVTVGGEQWAVFVGQNVSMAHQALIHGPSYVGDDSFIGFKAVVHDSVVGANCYVGIGATVLGVEVPDGRYVPHGAIIDTQEKANALPPVTEAHRHFNEDVVEVNRGLAAAYHAQNRVSPGDRFGESRRGIPVRIEGKKPGLRPF
jgi:SulP family sulfate permease